jgi:CDP-diacylglycerol---serine O-phosphatidyltransferase
VARLLKASSRFGAELDSLADFVNFGVAPAFLIFNWGLGGFKSAGWIVVLMFALASALRLARFNVAIDDNKPKWQSNFFIGMPTPAAAIVVLLPFYIDHVGLADMQDSPWLLRLALVYTLIIALLMVSAVPTYSGKLLGERIQREWVLPMFIVVVGAVALLVTYPYGTLAGASIAYLAMLPVSYRRFYKKLSETEQIPATGDDASSSDPGFNSPPNEDDRPLAHTPSGETKH